MLIVYRPVKKHMNEIREYTYMHGTKGCPIPIWASHIMSIRLWDVPYTYGTKYAYRIEHIASYNDYHTSSV